MEIKVKIGKSIVPNPEQCWSAELWYDGKSVCVALAKPETAKKAAEFCRKSPFVDRKNLNIQFWDYSERQVRESKNDGNKDSVVIYKIANETKERLEFFIGGLISTAKEFHDVDVSVEYLGRML